jgi:hypothetical protein
VAVVASVSTVIVCVQSPLLAQRALAVAVSAVTASWCGPAVDALPAIVSVTEPAAIGSVGVRAMVIASASCSGPLRSAVANQ